LSAPRARSLRKDTRRSCVGGAASVRRVILQNVI